MRCDVMRDASGPEAMQRFDDEEAAKTIWAQRHLKSKVSPMSSLVAPAILHPSAKCTTAVKMMAMQDGLSVAP